MRKILSLLIILSISVLFLRIINADIFLNKVKKAYKLSGVEDKVKDKKEAPSILFTEPVELKDVSGILHIAGTASDNYGITKIELKIGSGNWIKLYEGEGVKSKTFEYNLNTETYPNDFLLIKAAAYDHAENRVETEVQVHVLNKPKVAITSPVNHFATNSGTLINVSGTATPTYGHSIEKVKIYFDGVLSLTTNGVTTWKHTLTGVSQGSHMIYAESTSSDGLISDMAQIKIYVDSTNPTVTITSPSNNQIIGRKTFTVQGITSDTLSGISKVLVTKNTNSPWYIATGTNPWSQELTFTSGMNYVYARSYDHANNKSPITKINVLVDTSSPTVAFTYPADNFITNTQNIIFKGTATDNHGVVDVKIKVNNGNWQKATGTGSWTFSSNSSLILNTINTIYAKSSNIAGNVSTISSNKIFIDTIPPSASINSPQNGDVVAQSCYLVQGSASDIGSGLQTVYIKLNNGVWKQVSFTGTSNWECAISPLVDRTNRIYIKALDYAGNMSTTANTWLLVANANVYVSLNGNDLNPGTKAFPFKTIQYAIGQAVANNLVNVCVAQGTYNETITLADGKSLKGGYNLDFSACDPNLYKTTITGKISGNNVNSLMLNNLTLMNGIKLTTANDIILRNLDATISGGTGNVIELTGDNYTIDNNKIYRGQRGLSLIGNNNIIRNSSIFSNSFTSGEIIDYYGAGIYLKGFNNMITNCIIKNNSIILTLQKSSVYYVPYDWTLEYSNDADGGGLYIYSSGNCNLIDTTISDNHVTSYGLTAQNFQYVCTLHDPWTGECIVWTQYADYIARNWGLGGGMYRIGDINLIRCTIINNTANGSGDPNIYP